MEPAPQFHSFSNSATLSNWNCHQLRGVTQKDKMSPNVISVSTRAAPPPWQAPTEHQSQIQLRPTLCLRLHPTASRWPIWNKEREEKAIYFHTTPYDVRLDKKNLQPIPAKTSSVCKLDGTHMNSSLWFLNDYPALRT